MKKFFGITMAAVCALSMAAVGFSACDEDSDVVTEEEWIAAMSADKALNVTVDCALSGSNVYEYSDGTTETETYIENGEAKTDLTDCGTYITGTTSFDYSFTESTISTDESYEDTSSGYSSMTYEVFTAESYSKVTKYTEDDGSERWYGSNDSSADDGGNSNAYNEALMLTECAEAYSYFTYSDGAYRYSETEGDDEYSMEVRINDGNLVSMSLTVTESYTYSDYTVISIYNMEYTFSDYGTTTVEVPEEYTYEYYHTYNANT